VLPASQQTETVTQNLQNSHQMTTSTPCTMETYILAPASNCSDSEVSSDQQLPPVLGEVVEDERKDLLPSMSSGSGSSPLETSNVYSDQQSPVQEDFKVDPSVFSHLKPVCVNLERLVLPVSLKDVKDTRTIKIINASGQNVTRNRQSVAGVCITTGNRATLQTSPVLVKSSSEQEVFITTSSSNGSVSEEMCDHSDSHYPRLQLTCKIAINIMVLQFVGSGRIVRYGSKYIK
jgi:hypothetical protein